MYVPGQISPSMVRSAAFPLTLQSSVPAKGCQQAQNSFILSGDHCDFTSFDYMDQANLIGC